MHAVRYLKMSDHRYILKSSTPLTLDNWNFNHCNSISQCKRQKFHPVITDLQSDIFKHYFLSNMYITKELKVIKQNVIQKHTIFGHSMRIELTIVSMNTNPYPSKCQHCETSHVSNGWLPTSKYGGKLIPIADPPLLGTFIFLPHRASQ